MYNQSWIDAGKANFAVANERRKAQAAAKRAVRQEARARRLLLIRLKKLLKQRKSFLLQQERIRLSAQHGTGIADYYRCKKANTSACEPCLAAAAAYRRAQVAKDPAKFKQQDKDYYKKYPHKRLTNNRERARKKGVPSQYYTRQQIFNRDGYDCYLCNLPVELTANHIQGQPGWELYPHIEHVIPLALGGHDTLANVKIAHAVCNIRKGVSAPVAV
jgi:5-methylcytosine-specific restriction endonuclease McrA